MDWRVALVVGWFLVVLVVVCRQVRRAIRYRRVRRERDADDLRQVSPPLPLADRDRSDVPACAVPVLRPAEPRDSAAARVLAFHARLERRGYYVDELRIEKRLN